MKYSITLVALLAMTACNNANNETAKTPKADSPAVAAAPAKTETAPKPPMDSATQMKMWMEYATPGDMHKMMASWDGKWESESTYWEDEKKPPQKSTGTCENKMIMGGRYQESVHKSKMMGMEFEGHGTLAYDNAKKVFMSSWIDNMGTGMMYMEGPYDAAAKTVTLKGTWDDPFKGKTEVREVFKIVDDKHQEMVMYGTPQGGKEFKWMEMKFSRK